MMKRSFLLFLFVLVVFIGSIARLDRHYFKSNKSFNIQMILSTLPPQPQWKTPPVSAYLKEQFLEIFSHKFHYLNRGGQSAVFLSDDGQHVLKFYRFPSHLRPLGWLKHPISYHLSKKREAIKAHNFEKIDVTFSSFLLAIQELKEESGLLYVHLNPTQELSTSVTLVDALGSHYLVDLDRVTFVLQKRADGIFSTLDQLIKKHSWNEAKAHLDSLLTLITSRCKKGITDKDALLDQNYGFANGKAIHVDIGRLEYDPSIKEPEKMAEHTHTIVWRLRTWLHEEAPELGAYFEEKISSSF